MQEEGRGYNFDVQSDGNPAHAPPPYLMSDV